MSAGEYMGGYIKCIKMNTRIQHASSVFLKYLMLEKVGKNVPMNHGMNAKSMQNYHWKIMHFWSDLRLCLV